MIIYVVVTKIRENKGKETSDKAQRNSQSKSIRSYKLSEVEIAKYIEAAVTEKLEHFEGGSEEKEMEQL